LITAIIAIIDRASEYFMQKWRDRRGIADRFLRWLKINNGDDIAQHTKDVDDMNREIDEEKEKQGKP
jgi:hypothetical protein